MYRYTMALIVSLSCIVASSLGNVGEEGGACGMRMPGPCNSSNHAESLGPDSPLESASQPLQPRNNREAPGMDQQTTGGSLHPDMLPCPVLPLQCEFATMRNRAKLANWEPGTDLVSERGPY